MNNDLKGRRIKMINMSDPQAVPNGTMGTITHVDGIGQIHVRWDNGSRLAVVPDEDIYEIIY
jgi:hypothetical protein